MSRPQAGSRAGAVVGLLLLAALAARAAAEPARLPVRLQLDKDPDLAAVPEAPASIVDLDAFVAQVLQGNVDVAVARQEVERARGLARQALAALLPTLSASGSLQYHQPTGGYAAAASGAGGSGSAMSASSLFLSNSAFFATGTLSLSQSLLSPRALYAIGTSDRSIASAQATADDRVRTTLITAADDLLAEVSAARTAEVSRVGLRSAIEVMAMTARKVELGSATQLDLLRTKQDVENARATVLSANEALRKTREALGLVMGMDTAFGASPTLPIDSIEAVLQRRCQPRSLEQRSDLRAATLDSEIAERTMHDSLLAYAPSLSLSSNASVSNVAQLSGENWSFSVLGTLSVPIWDGGASVGARRAARATLAQKRAQLDGVTRAAAVQQTQTARSVLVAEAAQAVAQRSQAQAAELARLTRAAFASGTGTSFDVVDAARKAREAELDLIGKKVDLLRARVEALLAAATCAPGYRP